MQTVCGDADCALRNLSIDIALSENSTTFAVASLFPAAEIRHRQRRSVEHRHPLVLAHPGLPEGREPRGKLFLVTVGEDRGDRVLALRSPETKGVPAWPGPPRFAWSGKRDLNPRPLPWQGSALPLSY